MDEGEGGKLLYLEVACLIHAQVHHEVDHAVVDELVEEGLVVGEQRDGEHGIGAHRRWEFLVHQTDNEIQKLQLNDLLNHIWVEADESRHPGELFQGLVVDLSNLHRVVDLLQVPLISQSFPVHVGVDEVAENLKRLQFIFLVICLEEQIENLVEEERVHVVLAGLDPVASQLCQVLDRKATVILEGRGKEHVQLLKLQFVFLNFIHV